MVWNSRAPRDLNCWLGSERKRAAGASHGSAVRRCSPTEGIRFIAGTPKPGSNPRCELIIQEIDASLAPAPVYGQVPAFAAAERGVLDLLAVDHRGRLAVIELKASEDVHLPLQALDYWMRVQWHVEHSEFQANGYFPGTRVASRASAAAPGFARARLSSLQ